MAMPSRSWPRECEGCEETSFEVGETTVDGETHRLCPDCSRKVALGGMDVDEIGPSEDELVPDPKLPDVPIDLVDELPETRRGDYRAIVFDDERPSDRAAERDVTTAAVSQNVSSARDRLLALSQEAL